MRLRKLGERELLAVIRRHFTVPRKDVLLGIGDDTAVLKPGQGQLLVTKDLLVEDYDFIVSLHDPRLLGRKSLNVNISDIAAMGGRPLYAVLGWGFRTGPRSTGSSNSSPVSRKPAGPRTSSSSAATCPSPARSSFQLR